MRQGNDIVRVGEVKPASRFLQAAAKILVRAKEPLSAHKVTARAIKSVLLDSRGKTPERTMAAQLYVGVIRNPNARFQRIAKAGHTRAVRNSVKWTLR